jgi:hypothetical protein
MPLLAGTVLAWPICGEQCGACSIPCNLCHFCYLGVVGQLLVQPSPVSRCLGCAMPGSHSSLLRYLQNCMQCMPSKAGARFTETPCILVAGAIFGLGSALALILHRHRDANKGFSEVQSAILEALRGAQLAHGVTYNSVHPICMCKGISS